jgi:hypothetical protein
MKQLHFCYWTKKPKSLFKESPISAQNLSHAKFLKLRNSLFLVIFLLGIVQLSYSTNYYRSRQQTGSGPWYWGTSASWQYSIDKINWNDAISIPDSINSDFTYIEIGTGITLNRNESAKNLIVGGKIIVESGYLLKVTEETDLTSKLRPPSAGQIILMSSNSGQNGSIISGSFMDDGGYISLQRFMSKTDNWHLYSSPLSTQPIFEFIQNNKEIPDLKDSNGAVIGVGMRDYNTTLDKWSNYFVYNANSQLPSGNIEVGKGYSIRTIIAGSSANAGMIVSDGVPVPNNTFSVALNSTGNRWNCIGNPFTSAISVPIFLNANSGSAGSLDESGSFLAVYIWDTNNLFGNPSPQYVASNFATPGITSIQLGQGFFVKAKSGGSGVVNFTPGMRIFDPTLTFKSMQIEFPTIKILATSQSIASSTQIKFISNTSKGLDPGYDAGMIKQDPDFALYSKLLDDNGVDFTLQCLPDKNFDQYVIPIGIDCKVGGDIIFTAETVNLPSGCQALLEDRLTKRFTRLDLKDAKYTATVSADTKGIGRFYLHTSDVISGDQPIEKEQFKVNTIGKTVYINGEVSDKANFFVYSVNGKLLANFKAESLIQNQFNASELPVGVYILTVNDQNQKKSVKFVIEN